MYVLAACTVVSKTRTSTINHGPTRKVLGLSHTLATIRRETAKHKYTYDARSDFTYRIILETTNSRNHASFLSVAGINNNRYQDDVIVKKL